jgi:laccase
MGGVAKIPAAALWLLLGVVVALGVAATPAQAFRRKTNRYDFVVSRSIDRSRPNHYVAS